MRQRHASGPLLLLGLVIGGWVSGRAAYREWGVVPPAYRVESRFGEILPVGRAVPLWHQGQPRAWVAEDRPVTSALLWRSAQSSDDEPVRQRRANIGVIEGGGMSPYVRQQLTLLRYMLRPLHSNATAPSWGPESAESDVTGGRMAASPPSAQVRAPAVAANRWDLSAWAHYRGTTAPSPLLTGAEAGQLGGSQAGMRLSYLLDRDGRATIYARITGVPHRRNAAEGALGMAVRPVANGPVALVIERRQRIRDGDGRNATALYAVGGISDVALPARFRLDVYGASGVVGVRRRTPFAEGSLVASREVIRRGPLRFSVGAGAWGGAQPGTSRLDVGPSIVTRIDLSGAGSPRLAFDYRQRIAGGAAPNSGVAVTLSTNF